MATKIALRVLAIGLFAGTLDIADSLIFNILRGITPVMVLQYIASGLIGAASFRGGLASKRREGRSRISAICPKPSSIV
ncbi:MAG: hypothetical protein JOZ31_05660 [Verrucomicrobia bacterium]|nr:hypothetical protein [Verrucomicrobiota bacterium]MBV8484901.1 hypothetical protein [Verrucomicrobiota bacterium]